jgi:hypothetical protein
MKQERILIDFDKESAEKKIQQIEFARKKLQKIYKSLTEIIGEPISKAEFLSIFDQSYSSILIISDSRVKDLFVSKRAPEGKIGGIPVNTDMINLPDISFMKANEITSMDTSLLSQGYLSVENGEIVKAKNYTLRVTEEFKLYAEKPAEIERYRLAKNLSDAWNAVANSLTDPHFYETLREDNMRTVIDSDDVGVFHPSPYYIKTGEAVMQYSGLINGIQAPASQSKGDISDSYVESLLQDGEEGKPKPSNQE